MASRLEAIPSRMTDPTFITNYIDRLRSTIHDFDWSPVVTLAADIHACWSDGRQLFLCGNGGSAANAIHLANDFLYGIAKPHGLGLKVTALPANSSVLTCLANDTSYTEIFSRQLAVLGGPGDLLLVLSGSGNSPNVMEAVIQARKQRIKSYAIVGFDGGRCRSAADVAIHFPVQDMQISEDLQLIVGHMVMQRLCELAPLKPK
jgi:D-sedoheptulose 7-phosphate isomerase